MPYFCANFTLNFPKTAFFVQQKRCEKQARTTDSVTRNSILMAENLPKTHTTLADFLQRFFTGKVQKLSINAGFSCPNRDGTFGFGGCTYCNNRTFSPDYCHDAGSIAQQLQQGKAFFARKYPQMRYLAYFQAYTSTYAPTEKLIRLYDEALGVAGVVGLIIGTRPDCMPHDLLEWLAERAKTTFVMVEYGIESCHDTTLRRINRGHTFACAAETVRRTREAGIKVGGHFILGLPGETHEDIMATIPLINALELDTVKFHQLQIVRGTPMAWEYGAHPEHFGLYRTAEDYCSLVCDVLERLSPTTAVERFTSSSPRELLIAPDWGLKNFEFAALVVKEMRRRGSTQGCLCPIKV